MARRVVIYPQISVPDASNSVKGITKLSVAPASPAAPIALGANEVTGTPTPGMVPRADGAGKLDSWVTAGVPTSRNINTSSPLAGGGNLSADRTISLNASGVTPGTYGDSTHVPVPTFDAYGRATGVALAAVTGTVPSGTRQGQVLVWNGSVWATVQWPNYIDLPPASASSIDDEFDGTSLGGAWNTDTGVSSGTVNFAATVFSALPAGTALYDLNSEPGSLLLQTSGDVTSRGVFRNVASYYAANSSVMLVCKVTAGFSASTYAGNDSVFEFYVTDSTSKTNWSGITLQSFSGNYGAQWGTQSLTNRGQIKFQASSGQAYTGGPIYLALWRNGTTWTCFVRTGQNRWQYFGTGGSATNAFTPTYVYMRVKNFASPNSVMGVDWIRANNTGVLPTGG